MRVDVYPTRGGVPVADLTLNDFEVLEDGAPQKIDTFEHVVVRPAGPQEMRAEPDSQRQANQMAQDPRARVFVIFLDTYHVTVTGSHNIRRPLISLMDQIIGPDDLIGFMTPEMSAASLTLGRKTQVLEGALTDNWVWGRRFQLVDRDPKEDQYEACYRGLIGGEPIWREMVARRRERLVLDSLEDLVVHLRGVREERKAIIAVSEGWLQFRENLNLAKPLRSNPEADPIVPGKPEIYVGPGGKLRAGADPRDTVGGASMYECDADRQRLAHMDNERYFRQILDDANRANASFYPVDPRGLPVFDNPIGPDPPPPVNVDRAMLRTRQESLMTLAAATDGIAVMNSNDIERGLKRVAADLHVVLLARLLLDEHEARREVSSDQGPREAPGRRRASAARLSGGDGGGSDRGPERCGAGLWRGRSQDRPLQRHHQRARASRGAAAQYIPLPSCGHAARRARV